MNVTLAHHEIRMACGIAIDRRMASMGRMKHKYGYDGAAEWEQEIQSTAAEVAVAKGLGRYYDGSVNTFKRGDVGDLQVRQTAYTDGHLIVRPEDSDDDIFILVRGRIPTFEVVGWIVGRDAKRDEWLRTATANRPPAWFVPGSDLRQFSETAVAA